MKKLCLLILAGILTFTVLTGCGGTRLTSSNTPSPSDSKQSTAAIDNKPAAETARISDSKASDIQGPNLYVNSQYGFTFTLPDTWKGYSTVEGKWEGYTFGSSSQEVSEIGPMLSIRHPQWTQETPRQDIPIMIFTLDQWNSLQQDKFHIGAAPINPSELGRNNKYVFALPARYNFAFLKGYEEVETILSSNPIRVQDVR